MSTLMVQEHHLWLNLAEMDAEKVRFLDTPISQVDTVENFTQQFFVSKESDGGH